MDHISPSLEHDPAEGVLQAPDAAATFSLCPSPHPLSLKLHLQNQDRGQNNFFNNGMIIPPETRSLPLIPSVFPLKSDQMTQSTRKRAQVGM
jgi:hypothetical protein